MSVTLAAFCAALSLAHASAQEVVPIPLAGYANTAFHDPVASDRQGGWTDQGSDNDMSVLTPGRLKVGPLAFDVLDDAATGGKSCFVFSGPVHEYLPQSGRIPVNGAPVWNSVYLLHAAAWLPESGAAAGVLKVVYTDGTRDRIEVLAGRDVRDWWNPGPLSNAVVAWSGHNKSNEIGLYASKFTIQPKPVKEIQLESTGKAVWMVAAISASSSDIPLPVPPPFVITANDEWRPFSFTLDIAPGSIFDFSSLSDAPAGKYGPVKVTPDGHFEFANRPGERVRFSGTNVRMGAIFLKREQADDLAERLVRSGYNAVRLHLFDRYIQSKSGVSGELDPQQLEVLDYMFATLKNHGLYVNIDLHSYRQFTPAEVPELDRHVSFGDFKPLLHLSAAAFSAWQKFTEALLTHINPHTGLSWGKDPALIGICPVNEDPIYAYYRWQDPKIYQFFIDRMAQEQPGAQPTDDQQLFGFLTRTHIATDQRMRQAIASLGVTAPVTGMNMWHRQAQTLVRKYYDYVDNHHYFDHPRFPGKKWNLPYQFNQRDSIQVDAEMPRTLMPTRLFNKPFTVTEFNQAWPNRYRAEIGLMMSAYAGLQDWDALFSFGYGSGASDATQVERGNFFALSTDPIGMLADRVSSVMFRRGDARPAPQGVAYLVDEKTAFSGRDTPAPFPTSFSMLGLVTRIGSEPAATYSPADLKRAGITAVVTSPAAPAVSADLPQIPEAADLLQALLNNRLLPASVFDRDSQRYTSTTGQIDLWPKRGAMRFVSDRSECFVLPPNEASEGTVVSVQNGPEFGVVYVLSADQKPLRQSRRVLVVHLTDSLNSHMKFRDKTCTVVEEQGALPHLVRHASVTIALRDQAGVLKDLTVWPVNLSGKRGTPLPVVYKDQRLQFRAETASAAGVQLAYEIGCDQ